MKKKVITLMTALVCAALCAFSLAACGDKKDKNDVIDATDWAAAFTAAESATRYSWDYDCECDPEHDFISQTTNNIGYNADEDRYFKTWKASSGDFISRFTWKKNGKYYNKRDNEDAAELTETKYLQYTTFGAREKPFLLSFCKDRFSDFRYYSVSLEEAKDVEYKATDIEITVQGGANSFALSGRGNIYVTFTKDKAVKEIQAFIDTVDSGRLGYRLMDIGTYDNTAFDDFTLPDAQ